MPLFAAFYFSFAGPSFQSRFSLAMPANTEPWGLMMMNVLQARLPNQQYRGIEDK